MSKPKVGTAGKRKPWIVPEGYHRAWRLKQQAEHDAWLRDGDPLFLGLSDDKQKSAKTRQIEVRAATACQSPAGVMALANSLIDAVLRCDPASPAGRRRGPSCGRSISSSSSSGSSSSSSSSSSRLHLQ